MNYRSLGIAAVVAWVIDSMYGFLVFGKLLNPLFVMYLEVFRSFNEVSAMLPLMFASSLVATLVVAYIFAKGHDGGPGLQEGFRFGFVFALYGLFGISIPSYVIYRYGRMVAFQTSIAAFIEMLLMGIVLGVIYKPSVRRLAR